MKKQQSLLGKSNDSSYLAKRFATPVKVTSGIGLLAAGAIAVVGNGIDFPLPTLSSRFPTDGFSRKVGAKMVAKSLSNDFRFEDAVAMQETSFGNYEAKSVIRFEKNIAVGTLAVAAPSSMHVLLTISF